MYVLIYTSIQDKLQFCMLCLKHVSEMFVAAKRFQVGHTTSFHQLPHQLGWLGSRVVSVLDSGAEGPGSNRSRDAVG